MRFLGYSGWQLVVQLPTVLVMVVGLVLALADRRLPRGPRGLLLAGTAVLLLGALISLGWMLVLPRVVLHGGSAELNRLSLVVGPLLALLHPLGLGLIVAAALTGRRAATPTPPGTHWSGWQPGAGEPSQQQWTGANVPGPDVPGPDVPGPDVPGATPPSQAVDRG